MWFIFSSSYQEKQLGIEYFSSNSVPRALLVRMSGGDLGKICSALLFLFVCNVYLVGSIVFELYTSAFILFKTFFCYECTAWAHICVWRVQDNTRAQVRQIFNWWKVVRTSRKFRTTARTVVRTSHWKPVAVGVVGFSNNKNNGLKFINIVYWFDENRQHAGAAQYIYIFLL